MLKGKNLFDEYPLDVIICLLLSTILFPLSLLNVDIFLKSITGILFILVIPGYLFLQILFPVHSKKNNINIIERMALSFIFSIVIISLIGIIFVFTPLSLMSNLPLITIFTIIILQGLYVFTTRKKTNNHNKLKKPKIILWPKSQNNLDRFLKSFVVFLIIILLITIIYAANLPNTGERFTEFYILGENNDIAKYPKNLNIGEKSNITLGLINHEFQRINYTIEIWLINKTDTKNNSSSQNKTSDNHVLLIDKKSVTLNHYSADSTIEWRPQWEFEYIFSFNDTGQYQLLFLLFIEENNDNLFNDYLNTIDYRIDNAYRELHIWINIE